MGNTAFLFPGQASQYVGMGKDLYDTFAHVKQLYIQAQNLVPFDLKGISFEGPADELKQTRITQPAIFVHSVAVATMLEKSIFNNNAAAGHSLGEYSALVAAGSIGFLEGLETVALRGELMQNAGDERLGTMAAIIGMDRELLHEICEAASDDSTVVVMANFNAPGQIVISGDTAAVEKAMTLAKDAGAKRILPLHVSGAFHSPLMRPAVERLTKKLKSITIKQAMIPIYLNVTGEPERNPDTIRLRLIDQLSMPVLWEDTIRNMQRHGFSRFIELGPGKVLQGLVKRIVADSEVLGVDKVEDLKEI